MYGKFWQRNCRNFFRYSTENRLNHCIGNMYSIMRQSFMTIGRGTRHKLLYVYFTKSGDCRDQRLRLFKINRNFACFWPPNFLGDSPPPTEFLDLHYKIQPNFHHVANCHEDRPRELGDNGGEIKKYHGQNRRLPVLPYGRPKTRMKQQPSGWRGCNNEKRQTDKRTNSQMSQSTLVARIF